MSQTKLLLAFKKYVDEQLTSLKTTLGSLELKHGQDGKDGKDGRDGRDGKDGLNGSSGIDGRDGRDGEDGKDGLDGSNGVSVVDAQIDIDNHLTLTLSDGNEIDAGSLESLITKTSAKFFSNTQLVPQEKSWINYANEWSSEPTLHSTPSGGSLYTYTYLNGNLYRFVPDVYDPTQDAFYKDTAMTNLVATRARNI